jgi:hypothetical protein
MNRSLLATEKSLEIKQLNNKEDSFKFSRFLLRRNDDAAQKRKQLQLSRHFEGATQESLNYNTSHLRLRNLSKFSSSTKRRQL